ncbi:cytochrome c [Burkholderiales bacterium]|nr:cytochrome c [Burkholderiales bacterium]
MFNRLILFCFLLGVSVSWSVQAEDSAPRDAAQIVGEVCVGCHGVDGNAMVMGAPKLGGQKADYLAKSLMDYKTGVRNNAVMSAFSSGLSEGEMDALGKYFEGQDSSLSVPK